MFQQITKATTTRKLHYIPGGDGLAAIYVKNGQNDTMYYIHKDHLGSFDVVTGESGNVVERMSFDPWGRRRNPTNWTYSGVSTSYTFERGYTGHEHIDEFGLVNMNGRVYDAVLGRFLSPDKIVQFPSFTQSYNRYSYVFNNPLRFIDPSGWEGEEDDEGKDEKPKKDHQDGGSVILLIPVSFYQYCMWVLESLPDNGMRSISYHNGQPGLYYQWDPENGATGTSKKPFAMIGPGGKYYVWDPISIGGHSINIKSSPEAWIWKRLDPVDSWREIGSESSSNKQRHGAFFMQGEGRIAWPIGELGFTTSLQAGIIFDANFNVAAYLSPSLGGSSGGGYFCGVSIGYFPNAKSVSEIKGWGSSAGAIYAVGKSFGIEGNIAIGDSDFRLGSTLSTPISGGYGGAGYAEFSFCFMSRSVNALNMSAEGFANFLNSNLPKSNYSANDALQIIKYMFNTIYP